MVIQSGFFQSNSGDRRYTASYFASYFASFVGNGVFADPSTSLQVTPGTGLQVQVQTGKAWINGYYLDNVGALTINVAANNTASRRIDRIVARLNLTTREMTIFNKQGTAATTPVPQDLTRNNFIYELGLADIQVQPSATSITAVRITDLRPNTELCGYVRSTIERIDTTTIFNQYQAALDSFLSQSANSLNQFNVDSQAAINSSNQAVANANNAASSANAATNEVNQLLPSIQRFTDDQTNLQSQLDAIVANPNNGTETVQARVGYTGETYNTLKSRLDAEALAFERSLQIQNANLQTNTNTLTTFEGFNNGQSTNNVTRAFINSANPQYGYVSRVTLGTPITAQTRLAMQIPASEAISLINGRQYTISFEVRSIRAARLNYSFFINTGSGGNTALPAMNSTTSYQRVTINITWGLSGVQSQLLLGSTDLNLQGDWIEVRNLIISEGTDVIPYKPFVQLPTVSTQAQAQAGTNNTSFMTPLRTQQAIDTLTNRVNNLPVNSFDALAPASSYPLGTTSFLSNNPTNRFNNFQTCGVFTNVYYRFGQISTAFQIISPYRSSTEGTVAYIRYSQLNSNSTSSSWGAFQPLGSSGNTNDLQAQIGTLSALQTTNRTDLVNAINSVFQEVDNGKNLVAAAITDRGVSTLGTATFQTMSDNIRAINASPRSAQGTANSSGTAGIPFSQVNGTVVNFPAITVSGLSFTPSRVVIYRDSTNYNLPLTNYMRDFAGFNELIQISSLNNTNTSSNNVTFNNNVQSAYTNSTGFRMPVSNANTSYRWYAYE